MFKKIGGFFGKLFGKAPSVLQTISTTLTLTAPAAEEIYVLVTNDPADAAESANVVAEIQADLTAASTLIAQSHNSADASTYQKLDTILGSVKSNLQNLLTAGHIKNPQTLAKVTGIANLAIRELDAILTVVGQQKTTQGSGSAALPIKTTTAALILFALMFAMPHPASAGVIKFSAKHVVKPAAKASVKAAKTGAHVAVKTAKAGKKVLY